MVKILDSTLREGEQTPGVCFSNHIKTAIAELLDEIGIDIIEAGHPAVTDEIRRFIRYISQTDLKTVIGSNAGSTFLAYFIAYPITGWNTMIKPFHRFWIRLPGLFLMRRKKDRI
jgi:hypothetical protein